MSKFDRDILPGDIVTTYNKGFHRVTKVEQRFYNQYDKPHLRDGQNLGDKYSSLIYYVQVADKEGRPRKSKERSCDAFWCTRYDRGGIMAQYDADVARAVAQMDFLLGLLESSCG